MPVLVVYNDRLETVLVVMAIEQAQLLLAVNGIEGVINIQHDPLWHLPEPGAVEIDQSAAHAQQGTGIGQVLQARTVDCEHRPAPSGRRSSASLNAGSRRRLSASLPSS
jgi:hypothetical protein